MANWCLMCFNCLIILFSSADCCRDCPDAGTASSIRAFTSDRLKLVVRTSCLLARSPGMVAEVRHVYCPGCLLVCLPTNVPRRSSHKCSGPSWYCHSCLQTCLAACVPNIGGPKSSRGGVLSCNWDAGLAPRIWGQSLCKEHSAALWNLNLMNHSFNFFPLPSSKPWYCCKQFRSKCMTKTPSLVNS